jgi:chromosome segregation ATPase
MTAELTATKKAADKVSTELESTKGKLEKATAKGKELGDEVKELKVQLSQSQKEHDAAVKAGSALSQQLECLKGEYAAKAQEYECTMKAANEEFANKEKQMTAELTATKKAADKVSTELESTKGKLEKATAKGKELGDQMHVLSCRRDELESQCSQLQLTLEKTFLDLDHAKSQMIAKQRDHDAALQAVHDDVAVHIESGIRAAQKLFSSDLTSSKKSVEKLSSDLKVAVARAEAAEKSLACVRSDMESKLSAVPQGIHVALDDAQQTEASSSTTGKVEIAKPTEAAPVAAPESRRRVLECAPAHIVDGPGERPKRRPLSAVDVNAVASSQPSKVRMMQHAAAVSRA